MTGRVAEICGRLSAAEVFADVGCDHGYMTRYMLDKGLCRRAYVSDVSAGSLKKAEKLLAGYIRAGRCIPVAADGLHGIQERCDLVLIAGLGGEEIVRILKEAYLPQRFVLQPMKNSEKVRAYLVEEGARIECDYVFEDGKFYELIAGTAAGGDRYSDYELRFGRDNLKAPSAAFIKKLRHDAGNLKRALSSPKLGGERRDEVRERLYEIEVITDAIAGDL